ncbi:diacylglycerol/lipid kinase family protein [Anaerococcus sp. Marseille-P3915]|uniref:diacylglycerol/lipid kinase family protein n=1 Tax=Anaerococcus sp. Marseille-P3915 TaxID=2057799 RepID=UPI000D0BB9C4|nr:diacylglycerol kinase family protein [Anaerococcus sp. Marseille-P3915]
MKKMLFVYNPNSGQRAIQNSLSSIIEYLSSKGIFPTVYATQKSGDCREIVEKYGKDFDNILVSGGDGTLDEAVSAALRADIDPTFSYIPTGSTNDFSRSVNISPEIDKATRTAVRGKVKRIDVGKIDDKYFVYVAAFGALSDISFSTDQDMKNILGRSAYIVEGLKNLLPIQSMKSYQAEIEIDHELIKGDFIHFMASNSISVGGFTDIFDGEVGLSDGLFEITLVKRPESLIDLNKIIQALTNNESNDFVIRRQASSLRVKTDEEVSWSLDGDFGGKTTDANIEVIHKRINIKTGLKD